MDTSDSGIFCPACNMKNDIEVVVCIYCKTPLGHHGQKTITFKKIQEITGTLPDYFDEVLDAPAINTERFMDFEIPSKGIVLINLENGQPITTQEENVFIIGRASAEIKMSRPLVDLTAFNALDYGISRVHAMIRKTPDGYQITDLGSTNGTWHENQRLVPKEPHLLESGDRIRLGRLHMLVFYP